MIIVMINRSGDIVSWSGNGSGGCCSSWLNDGGLLGSGWSWGDWSLNLSRRSWSGQGRGCGSGWRRRWGGCGSLDRLNDNSAVDDYSLDILRRSWNGTLGDGDINNVGDDVSNDCSGVECLVDGRGDSQGSAQGCENGGGTHLVKGFGVVGSDGVTFGTVDFLRESKERVLRVRQSIDEGRKDRER
jgi:hypothetical protein